MPIISIDDDWSEGEMAPEEAVSETDDEATDECPSKEEAS